jgi:hypothetical protein
MAAAVRDEGGSSGGPPKTQTSCAHRSESAANRVPEDDEEDAEDEEAGAEGEDDDEDDDADEDAEEDTTPNALAKQCSRKPTDDAIASSSLKSDVDRFECANSDEDSSCDDNDDETDDFDFALDDDADEDDDEDVISSSRFVLHRCCSASRSCRRVVSRRSMGTCAAASTKCMHNAEVADERRATGPSRLCRCRVCRIKAGKWAALDEDDDDDDEDVFVEESGANNGACSAVHALRTSSNKEGQSCTIVRCHCVSACWALAATAAAAN